MTDPYPDGHAIRREGASVDRDAVFIEDLADPDDVETARRAATFSQDMARRLAIQSGTLGYPDVDTYRDLYFIIEASP